MASALVVGGVTFAVVFALMLGVLYLLAGRGSDTDTAARRESKGARSQRDE